MIRNDMDQTNEIRNNVKTDWKWVMGLDNKFLFIYCVFVCFMKKIVNDEISQ